MKNKIIIFTFLVLVALARATNIDFIKGGTIGSNITLNVPSDYSTLQAAFDALADKQVTSSALITIQLADGSYSFSSSLVLPRSVSANLQILGNTVSPSSVVLTFTGGTSAFYMTDGQHLKYINGMTIDGVSKTPGTGAFFLLNSCSVIMGSAMILERFDYGVACCLASSVMCTGITVNNNRIGVLGNGSGSASAQNVIATNNTNYGFYAGYCGNILAYGSTVTGSPTAYLADPGSYILH